MGKRGTLWSDKLDKAKRHKTAGQTQLTGRNDLIRAVMAGDTVVVTNHLCLGVSPQDAGWFLEQMAERDVTVIINGDIVSVEPGGYAGHVLAEFHRLLNNYTTAKSRGRS